MSPELFWIAGPWKGRLAIATRPRGGDWIGDDVAALRRTHIDVLVSLLTLEEEMQLDLQEERQTAKSQGIRYISFPIEDRTVPESLRDSLALFQDLARELQSGKNVAVHCRQGIGRSSLVAAGAMIASGVSAEAALSEISAARGFGVPETLDQRNWVEQLSVGATR